MLTIQVDTSKLEAAIAQFAKLSRLELGDVAKKQAGILVGHVIAITPPGGKNGAAMSDTGGIALAAKKHGEAVISADIAALFPTTNLRPTALSAAIAAGFEFGTGRGRKVIRQAALTEADLERLHRAARSPVTGRIRTGRDLGSNMALTRAALRRAYTQKAKTRVGLLNAGWIQAARTLGTASRALPAWITRHGAKAGGADVADRTARVEIRIFNNQDWFPAGMESRVAIAVKRRHAGLLKAMTAILDRRAAAATRRMGR